MAPEHPSRARWRVAALAAVCVACACDAGVERPNILLYVSDTLRADGLGCYGNATVETPNFDRFAAEGVRFENALAPSSWTRASMGAILSGTAPAVHGAEGRYDLLEDSVVLISELLAAEGYATANITTNRNVGSFFGFDQGWSDGGFIELYPLKEDRMVRVNELSTRAGEVTDRAIEWLETAPQPFCLIVHTIDPHSPYTPPRQWDRYTAGNPSAVDGSQQSLYQITKQRTDADEAKVRGLYYGEIAYNDHAFGQLVDYLRERELYDDMLCVMTSDHGEEFWELFERGHGKTVNEKALHVPLMIRYPGRLEPAVATQLVTTTDVLPTILDLAGLTIPYWIRGRSILEAPATSSAERILFSSCLLGERELFVARTERWKLVWDARKDTRRLYDMTTAEGERENVAREHRDVVERLHGALLEELELVRDTRIRLHGAARAPEVGELPDDVRADLEAHGYLGDDEPDE